MSLPVTFHRAASAEFIEASAWYENKRVGLALEFMAEIDRCVSLATALHDVRLRSSLGFGHGSGLFMQTIMELPALSI